MTNSKISKIITVWSFLLIGLCLITIFGNFWMALGVLFVSISNKAEDLK